VRRGDRVAQLILERISMVAAAQEVQELAETSRGAGGFGSTGVAGAAAAAATPAPVAVPASEPADAVASSMTQSGISSEIVEEFCVKKLTEFASVPVRGSVHAAGTVHFQQSPSCGWL
jgi:hypothetical protein